MPLQSSGAISLNDIATEFGGTAPHSLSEYYRDGGLVTPNNTNVPTSGQISLSNFYSALKNIVGESSYTTVGTYTFTVPAGVTSICAVCVGGGGGGNGSFENHNGYSAGGGGGALSYANNISVSPGQQITVTVGAGGSGGLGTIDGGTYANGLFVGGNGSASSVGSYVNAPGGYGGFQSPSGPMPYAGLKPNNGGGWDLDNNLVNWNSSFYPSTMLSGVSGAGGPGGQGGSSGYYNKQLGGGGGGAGGYGGVPTINSSVLTTNGIKAYRGHGGGYFDPAIGNYNANGVAGFGGGGGGAYADSLDGGYTGGGVGLFGQEGDGEGGTISSVAGKPTYTTTFFYPFGGGGSGAYSWSTAEIAGLNGSGFYSGVPGRHGGVRIIWGFGRSFPSNAA